MQRIAPLVIPGIVIPGIVIPGIVIPGIVVPGLVLGLLSPWGSASRSAVNASAQGEPAPREIAALMPERCLVYLEGSGLFPLLEQGLEHPFVRALQATELVRTWMSAQPVSPIEALARADAWLGEPALRAAAELCEHGLALGYDPATKKSVLLARGRDAETVQRHLAFALDAVERQYHWPGGLDAPQARWSGADVWRLGELVVARRDALLVLGNQDELVAEALELAADAEGRGLFARPGFAGALAERPAGAALWAWLDLAGLEPYGDDGFRKLRASNRAPGVQGVLGARFAALVSAPALALALSLHDADALELRLRAPDAPCVRALAPLARDAAVPALPRGGLADALLYRDYARYFTQRSELFPAEVLPKFAEAITNGALFFGGQDLGEEVLPRLSPWIRIVSRPLAYADGRRPEIPLPGVAAIGVLDDAGAGEAWTAAFQTLVSILNVDRAQKGGQSLSLRLEREGEVEISAARFPAPGPADGVDVRYNLEPALAVVGRHLVLGTHVALVRELVRELATASPLPASAGRETLALDPRGLCAVVEQNSAALVANTMLEKGLAHGAAEDEIRGLRLALAAFESARIELAGDGDTAELALELRLTRAQEGR